MSATFYAAELTNLASEAKRRNNELRHAAEKSLQELKALPTTSEQQLAADLSRRASFIEPFLIACNTHTPRFAAGGVACLQRLVVSRGLPRSRLQDCLKAFNTCTDLSLDIQLKVLQALPSLLQNYASDLEGDLLSGALQVCSSLQAVKASTVSGVAAATLQQLVSSVFEKVNSEDKHAAEIATVAEIPGSPEPIHLRPAAYDAYRVFRDLAVTAEDRRATFTHFTSLSPESSLELIWTCIEPNPELFDAHSELLAIIGSNVFPTIVRALSERLSFSITVRALRLLSLILDQHMAAFQGDCEVALGLCAQCLDPDANPTWKRALAMEVVREFFSDSTHVIDAYASYDSQDSASTPIQDLMSIFVRLATEKPAAIGLGQQSSIPIGPLSPREGSAEQTTLEAAGGMAGVISSALGVAETNVAGISSQWSLPRSPCMEQLDKNEPPALPETYVYALILECLSGLSDSLARIVLPLTVHREPSKTKDASRGTESDRKSSTTNQSSRFVRSDSFRRRTVPLNPLEVQTPSSSARVHAVAGLVESCWPAVLATSSTFLIAALDDQYFRNLIKAYQRFAQVAGLLRLNTPRDALMTTLAKASVPPHVLTAATAFSDSARTPVNETSRIFSSPKGLLSMDSLVSQASSFSGDRDWRSPVETTKAVLTVRNLLCLRALLNLAIALGPTLESAFGVVIGALRQADVVLSNTSHSQNLRPSSVSSSSKFNENANASQAFSTEVMAVEAAANRLLESTADYPHDAFIDVLDSFCSLLHGKALDTVGGRSDAASLSPVSSPHARRSSSVLSINTVAGNVAQDYQFVIPKLGHLAQLNVSRFTDEDPSKSGWSSLVSELTTIATTNSAPQEARRRAVDVLVKLMGESIADMMQESAHERAIVQKRSLTVLLDLIRKIYSEDGELSAADLEVQGHVLEFLQPILGGCGDSLVAGWDIIIGIVSSAFDSEGPVTCTQDGDEVVVNWEEVSHEVVSPQTGRVAFLALQLVCSDFMQALPVNVLPSLVELLHRFMCQTEELNVALTTVTMAWNVSEFLYKNFTQAELATFITTAQEFEEFEEELKPLAQKLRAAQWLFSLTRLCDVAVRSLHEVRNAAFQLICNVFKTHGEDLPPAAWDLLLRRTILAVSRTDFLRYLQDDPDVETEKEKASPDVEMSKTIVAGVSGTIFQHLRAIERVSKLPSLWEVFLGMLERYIDVENHALNGAVYAALHHVLSHIESSLPAWKGPVYRTVSMWLKRIPTLSEDYGGKQSNQDAYIAYVEAGQEIYRLTRDTMTMSQTRTTIEILYQCLQDSDGPLHGADAINLSPLQKRVMAFLRNIRTDQPNIPACLLTVASKIATLHLDISDESSSRKHPTFLAVSCDAVSWLRELVERHVADPDLVDSDALSQAVNSLRRLIAQKYHSRTDERGPSLWKEATTTATALAKSTLERVLANDVNQTVRHAVWSDYVGIAGGIVTAPNLHAIDDVAQIYADQLFDIRSYTSLREVLVAHLGNPVLPTAAREAYVRALFEASLVHAVEPGEIPPPASTPLHDITKVRRGRVKNIQSSLREDMAYVCFRELIALSSQQQHHTNPLPPLEQNQQRQRQHTTLAQAAAPWLILRLAIPIRAYIADQPLRGRRSIPLSELDELLFCFAVIESLRLDPAALDGSSGSGSGNDRAHVRFVYPLLVQAIGIAGDKWCAATEILAPLQNVLASCASAV